MLSKSIQMEKDCFKLKNKEQRFKEFLDYEKIRHLDPKTQKRIITKMRKDFKFIEEIKNESFDE